MTGAELFERYHFSHFDPANGVRPEPPEAAVREKMGGVIEAVAHAFGFSFPGLFDRCVTRAHELTFDEFAALSSYTSHGGTADLDITTDQARDLLRGVVAIDELLDLPTVAAELEQLAVETGDEKAFHELPAVIEALERRLLAGETI